MRPKPTAQLEGIHLRICALNWAYLANTLRQKHASCVMTFQRQARVPKHHYILLQESEILAGKLTLSPETRFPVRKSSSQSESSSVLNRCLFDILLWALGNGVLAIKFAAHMTKLALLILTSTQVEVEADGLILEVRLWATLKLVSSWAALLIGSCVNEKACSLDRRRSKALSLSQSDRLASGRKSPSQISRIRAVYALNGAAKSSLLSTALDLEPVTW